MPKVKEVNDARGDPILEDAHGVLEAALDT